MREKENWDHCAECQQAVFRLGQNAYNTSLLRFWEENGMLPAGARVIDIGCGVGKYGTYLAEMGCDVTLVDISSEMLRRAAINMEPFHTPWRVFRCDFREVDPAEPVFAGGFDLAISTMSPAVCNTETVKKMSSVTHGWCFLARFSEWHQPLRDRILSGISVKPLPLHSDSEEDCRSMIRFVEEAGYTPSVRYVDYCWADERTPEQMSAFLLDRYFPDAANRKALCEELSDAAKKLAEPAGILSDAVQTKVAWIWWNTKDEP